MTKKKRFEVFKRDGFACAYCGQKPPAVVLEVDHIEPKSKGGSDEMGNLLTACFDCNRGKSDRLLNSVPGPLSENMELIKERELQVKEYRKIIRAADRRVKKDIEYITDIYREQYEGMTFTASFKDKSLRKFLDKLPINEVENALRSAIRKLPNDDHNVIKYFCGICWSEIKSKDPEQKIKNEWIRTCKYHGKNSWSLKDSDLFRLKNVPFDEIKRLMHKALEDYSWDCWDGFIGLCEKEGLIK